MPKVDTSHYTDFDQVLERLDQILDSVRDKNTSLEKSLDLFDEAIAVGSKGVEMVDKVEFSQREEALLAGAAEGETVSHAAGDSAKSEVSVVATEAATPEVAPGADPSSSTGEATA